MVPYYTLCSSSLFLSLFILSFALYTGVIKDFAVSLLASDLCRNTSLAFDAAAEFTDETLLWSAGPLSVIF